MVLTVSLFAAVLSAPISGLGATTLRSEAVVTGDRVRLDAVADLSALPEPLRARAAPLIVAVIPADQQRLTSSTALISQRARAQLPALAGWLPEGTSPVVIHRARPFPPAPLRASPSDCMLVARPLSAGETPLAADFQPGACPDRMPAKALAYDARTATVSTTRPLAVGEAVRPVPAASLATVRPGQALTLEARVGPVRVQRQVTAVRAAAIGRPVLVRADNGAVFVAQVQELAP